MVDHMEKLGAQEESLELMATVQLDGEMWRALVTDASGTRLKEDFESEIIAWGGKGFTKITQMSIVVQTKLAFEKWLQKNGDTGSNKPQLFTIKELHSIKIPELPAGKGVDGRVTGEQVKVHAESLNATFNIIDREYSNRIMAVHSSPTLETLEICLKDMTARSWQLNELVGSSFMKKAAATSVSTVIAMKRHMHQGRYCGLSIMQSLCASTTQLTGARLGDLLLKLFKPLIEKPAELVQLEPMYKTHKEALTSLRSLDIELHSVVQCFILQQMASKLATKPEHNLILGIPMASIVKKGFDDLTGMTSLVETAIIEASNDPRYNRPRLKLPKEKSLDKQVAAVTIPDSSRPCVHHREEAVTGFSCNKQSCRYSHDRSDKACTAPEYIQFGRCKQYFAGCKDNHPFTEEAKKKYGNPQVAWNALCAEFPGIGKKSGSNGKFKGKSYPVLPAAMAVHGLQPAEQLFYDPAWAPAIDPDIVTLTDSDHTESEADSDNSLEGSSDEDQTDSEDESEMVAMYSDASYDSNGLPELVLAKEDMYPPASLMTTYELERYMKRKIAPEHVGAVRFEAAIKMIEERETNKKLPKSEHREEIVDDELTVTDEDLPELVWTFQEHYAKAEGNQFEQAAMQLGSRADKYGTAEAKEVNAEEKERCQKFEQSIIDTLEQQGARNMIAAVSTGIPVLMFDSGTYKHILGTDMIDAGLVYDINALPVAEVVDTAAGRVTLKQSGKIQLRGIEFQGIINRMMRLSLLSEGLLFVKEDWKITGEDGVKMCQPATDLGIDTFKADMCGNLAFWPQGDIMAAMEAVQNGLYPTINIVNDNKNSTPQINMVDNPEDTIELFTQLEIDTAGDCNLTESSDQTDNAEIDTCAIFSNSLEGSDMAQPVGDTGDHPLVSEIGGVGGMEPPTQLEYEQDVANEEVTGINAATRAKSVQKYDFQENEHGETVLVEREVGKMPLTTTSPVGNKLETITEGDSQTLSIDKSKIGSDATRAHGTFSEIENFQNPSNFDNTTKTSGKDATSVENPPAINKTNQKAEAEATANGKGSRCFKKHLMDAEATTFDGKLPKDIRTLEYKQHCDRGHLPFDSKCWVCIQGGMRAKRSTSAATVGEAKARPYHHHLETAVTDNLMFNDTDADGYKAASGVYLPRTCFGEVGLLRSTDSVAKNRVWQKIQRYIQANTDPGGKLNYRIERVKMDQGTENQGAMLEGLAGDNIVPSEGHVDRHTDQSKIENYFGRLQTVAATMAIGAWGYNHAYDISTMGTRILHAAEVIKYKPCNAAQREMGVSPIQQQFHAMCDMEAPSHSYGEMIFGHIEKKDRANKTGARAFIGIYAGVCRRVKGNIMAHPIIPDKDQSKWVIMKSVSVNKYTIAPGHFVLNYPPDHRGQPEVPEEVEIMSYDDLKRWAEDQGAWDDSNFAISGTNFTEGEEEIEAIVEHVEIDDGDFDYKVRWKGHDESFDTWHTATDLANCQELIEAYRLSLEDTEAQNFESDELIAFVDAVKVYEQALQGKEEHGNIMLCAMLNKGVAETKPMASWQLDALLGNNMTCSYPVVEIPVKEFMKMEGGPEAVSKELTEMESRRFNYTKPVPEHLKKTALPCRLICTQKRDGRLKCRLVAKDLKSKRKLPETATYAAVPAMYGFRLMIAAADGKRHIISTTDFNVAYLQTENRDDDTTWVLISFFDPRSHKKVYCWLMGVIYGEQPAGKDWKDSLCHKMVVMGGFQEVLNMENMYYQPLWKVAVGVHVDDPLVVACDEDGHILTHKFLDRHFDTKGTSRLAIGTEIDYLSMELSLTEEYNIIITNKAKCAKLLEDAGKEDCTPTKKPPMTKSSLKKAMEDQTPLTDEEERDRLAHNGRFGWLAQTTHIGLAVATSIAQGLPSVAGTKAVSDLIYQWIQAHRNDGLMSISGDESGFSISTDADWAGMYSVTGETRSRTGVMIAYNNMPVLWYTGLQKTMSTQWTGLEEEIATSSANAEVMAASETVVRALHISYIAEELGMVVPRPLQIQIDASAALGFLNNTANSGKMKHIDICKGWVQQLRDRKAVEFVKVDGKDIKADFMTKLLDRVEYNRQYTSLVYAPGTKLYDDSDSDE